MVGKPIILVLGDSFTFGWMIRDEDSYVAKLQDVFPGWHFINAAAGGWGTADYARYVENYCNDINPQKIIVFQNSDDVGRAMRSSLYKLDSQGKIIPLVKPPVRLKRLVNTFSGYQWLLENSHLLQLVRNVYVFKAHGTRTSSMASGAEKRTPDGPISRSMDTAELEYAAKLATQLFARLKEYADSCGSELIVINLGWIPINDKLVNSEPTAHFVSKARRIFPSLNIDYDDLTPYLSLVHREKDRYIIPDDGHPNELGAMAIADAATPLLRQRIR